MQTNIINVTAAINYIERNLADKLDLEIVACAVHYSKYHLHRVFTDTVGLTIHDYVQRRRLTEAAKLLVLSDKHYDFSRGRQSRPRLSKGISKAGLCRSGAAHRVWLPHAKAYPEKRGPGGGRH